MIRVLCDKCGEPAVGFVIVGDPSGQRQFDLCPDHLKATTNSLGRYFGVSFTERPDADRKEVSDVEMD